MTLLIAPISDVRARAKGARRSLVAHFFSGRASAPARAPTILRCSSKARTSQLGACPTSRPQKHHCTRGKVLAPAVRAPEAHSLPCGGSTCVAGPPREASRSRGETTLGTDPGEGRAEILGFDSGVGAINASLKKVEGRGRARGRGPQSGPFRKHEFCRRCFCWFRGGRY